MAGTLGSDMDVKVKSGDLLIGDLSAATGASPRSLRHYEANGLLTARRDANGYRRYAPESVELVRRIRRLLGAGFSVETITVLLPCLDGDGPIGMCPAVAAEIRRHLASIDAQVSDLLRARENVLRLAGPS